MKLQHPLIASTLALAMISLTACKKAVPVNTKPEGKTAIMLLTEGEALLKHRKWEEGRKILRMVEDYFPGTPEFPKAKLLLADSYFFAGSPSYPEAQVEYQSFLNYFPRHESREYALYRIALCHFASIENAERDQAETYKALEAFQALLQEAPGSVYVVDTRAKITQCWRRLAEAELMVGIFYVYNMSYEAAERRLKDLLETYPEYVDRERAYFYLGEALRNKRIHWTFVENFRKEALVKLNVAEGAKLTAAQAAEYKTLWNQTEKVELERYRTEARSFYQKLVESYPKGAWAGRAKDRLLEMGQANVKEELDG